MKSKTVTLSALIRGLQSKKLVPPLVLVPQKRPKYFLPTLKLLYKSSSSSIISSLYVLMHITSGLSRVLLNDPLYVWFWINSESEPHGLIGHTLTPFKALISCTLGDYALQVVKVEPD